MHVKIEIEGLAAINRGLKAIDSEAPKKLRLALNSGANLLVAETRPTMPSLSGAARRSLVARSTRTSARVAIGGRKAPYVPWLDYGGEGRVAGRPAARPFERGGRYLYPTLRRISPKLAVALDDSIREVVSEAMRSGG